MAFRGFGTWIRESFPSAKRLREARDAPIIASFEYRHSLALFRGPAEYGDIELATLDPISEQGSGSFAKLESTAGGFAAGYYFASVRTTSTIRGDWWASIVLWSVDAELHAADARRIPSLSSARRVGEFEVGRTLEAVERLRAA
jgi:hypothetical protein